MEDFIFLCSDTDFEGSQQKKTRLDLTRFSSFFMNKFICMWLHDQQELVSNNSGDKKQLKETLEGVL